MFGIISGRLHSTRVKTDSNYSLQTILVLLLAGGSLALPSQGGEKICRLERSEQNGEDCFYEPECEDVCHPVIVEVSHSTLRLLTILG